MGFFYGVEGVEFVWNGTQADPYVEYKGRTYNYYDLEQPLWDEFKEETGIEDTEAFEKWVQADPERVYG